jgi:CO/xanthine dehydrogenase Mo-binding subunit
MARADRTRGEGNHMTTFGIGASVKRREDVRLLTGYGRYADDWNSPGQVHAAFVRSSHAHADVVAIDPAPARAIDGVLGVFTGRDLVADGVGPIPTLPPGATPRSSGRPGGGTRSRAPTSPGSRAR